MGEQWRAERKGEDEEKNNEEKEDLKGPPRKDPHCSVHDRMGWLRWHGSGGRSSCGRRGSALKLLLSLLSMVTWQKVRTLLNWGRRRRRRKRTRTSRRARNEKVIASCYRLLSSCLLNGFSIARFMTSTVSVFSKCIQRRHDQHEWLRKYCTPGIAREAQGFLHHH